MKVKINANLFKEEIDNELVEEIEKILDNYLAKELEIN